MPRALILVSCLCATVLRVALEFADDVEHLHSPVPTRMISNGEHMPIPQTSEQRAVPSHTRYGWVNLGNG